MAFRIKITDKGLLAGVIFATLYLAFLFKKVDYDTASTTILRLTGTQNKDELFKELFFPLPTFTYLKIAGYGTFLLFTLFEILLFMYPARFANRFSLALLSLKKIKNDLQRFFSFYSELDKGILILLSAVLAIHFLCSAYFSVTAPISVDEAGTYLNFTLKGPLASLAYYPDPNNHILFSLLSNLTRFLPGDPKIIMRLISVFISIFTNLVFFRYSSAIFSKRMSIFLLALFSFSYMNFLYSFQARGYEIVLLCSLLLFYCAHRYSTSFQRKYITIFILASIAGFFAIPSFLYPFLSVNAYLYLIFLTRRKRDSLWVLTKADLLVALSVVLLYTPVILVNGIKALVANKYTMPIERSEVMKLLLPHLDFTLQTITGIFNPIISWSVCILAAVSLVLIIFRDRNRQNSVLPITILILWPILILIHSVIPFPRTWIYLTIPLTILTGYLLTFIPQKKEQAHFIYPALSFLIIFIFLANFPGTYKNNKAQDYCVESLARKMDLTKIQTLAYDEVNLADILSYYIFRQNKKPVTYLHGKESCDADAIILSDRDSFPAFQCGDRTGIFSEGSCKLTIMKRKD